MILAGDIGGTKTVLTRAKRLGDGTLKVHKEETFASGEYESFEEILELFLAGEPNPESACFGIAGPVIGQRCQTTNLPWLIDGLQLKEQVGIERVCCSTIWRLWRWYAPSGKGGFRELNPNAQPQAGNIAVIAAGTGLGEAILYWDGAAIGPWPRRRTQRFRPAIPTQVRLLEFLQGIYPEHVSWERIVSGGGFSHLYDFLLASGFAPACPPFLPAPTWSREWIAMP